MAAVHKETSRGDDNQRGRPAKKKNTTVILPSADDAALPCETSGRIHIFKGKPLPAVPPKSDGERLQFSSFKANTLTPSGHGDVHGAIAVGIQPTVPGIEDQLIRLIDGIEKGKRAAWQMAMKVEDLRGLRQTLRRTRDSVFKRRG